MACKVLNFNIGVLGHVDSGKTSLSKALSTVSSTAAFDKNPQSKERGITLDLGFSCFIVDAPEDLQKHGYEKLQFTLVDCPGHSSLIRTVIGGAQIIDAMILVVDITKGIQTQTAECLVIGEILCNTMLIVLNKVDLIPAEKQNSTIEKMTKRLLLTLKNTKFANSKIVTVAAKPGGPDAVDTVPVGIVDLMETLKNMAYLPKRDGEGPFLYAVDHCFSIKGQGTVMTGTVLQGKVTVNDVIEIPTLKVTKKVKSMQMFKKAVESAKQGDRLGICVTQFDPKLLERGYVCSPGFIQTAFAVVAEVERIGYYKSPIQAKAKFHISMGHETVMAKVSFFTSQSSGSDDEFTYEKEYEYKEKLEDMKGKEGNISQFALLEFEKVIPVIPNAKLIGSKLDMDTHTNMCRIAFHGKVIDMYVDKNYPEIKLKCLKVFKCKSKEGHVERMVNDNSVIVKNLLKKDTNVQLFIGLKVQLSTGETGTIEGTFGQSGKVKVYFMNGLETATKSALQTLGKKKGKGAQNSEVKHAADVPVPVTVHLHFKKYMFDPSKKLIQS
ncbi:eukaryotic translation elongation factor, selenocysteine-specific [Oratosquilla oratoria]|uniref:eukaryotic translation elongation factor, selenocysteine-specific n=1 Tax=Oratosquilla oratoria TaxID=337810 RepID=UPI003F76C566